MKQLGDTEKDIADDRHKTSLHLAIDKIDLRIAALIQVKQVLAEQLEAIEDRRNDAGQP